MREIKFRAWDKVKKEYIYSSLEHAIRFMDIHFNPPYQELPIGFGLYPEEIARFEYEQYTGLSDKNGKEIYEGDILSYNIQDYNGGDHFYIHKIEYGGAEFGCNGENCDYWFWNSLNTIIENDDEIEVIGNIHENHELLNVESNPDK